MRRHYLLRNFVLFMCVSMGSFLVSCGDDDAPEKVIPEEEKEQEKEEEKEEEKEKINVWSETMAGNDMEEIAWPDQSENYWEYTMDVTEYPNVGLRFKGEFPKDNARFFNFTFYDDNSTVRITSIEDFNIEPEEGSVNPFLKEYSGSESNYFEVNILPDGVASNVKEGMKNVLEFPAKTKKLSVLLRIYFNTTDHDLGFGGVDLPEVFFIDAETGEEIEPAVRAKSQYYDRCKLIINSIPTIQPQRAMVFTLAPDVMYSNGPTGYVTSANRMSPDSVLLFRFIPPVHPTEIADNLTADVRYWSICVGDTLTHTPITVPDRLIKQTSDGYVNFMIIEENTPLYEQTVAKAESMGINTITWNSETYGDAMMVFYRQMYIREGFEYSVRNIPFYPPLNELGLPDSSQPIKPENMAHIALGEHGPSGLKLPETFVLSDYFSLDYMRIPNQ